MFSLRNIMFTGQITKVKKKQVMFLTPSIYDLSQLHCFLLLQNFSKTFLKITKTITRHLKITENRL